MHFTVLTLFPDMVRTILGESILGRGEKAGCFTTSVYNIRDFAENKHNRVDDTPYGGGYGMVMAAPPILRAHRAAVAARPAGEEIHTVYLSPRGQVLTQAKARELLQYDTLILLCGHYEGVDQRAIDAAVDEEISVGDYILTGGELPACLLVDAVARMLPGVLADPACYLDESIASGLLEYPQYTRPPEWEGRTVPEVLLSGDHARIDDWRYEESYRLTEQRRPDLLTAELRQAYADKHAPKKKRRKKSVSVVAPAQEQAAAAQEAPEGAEPLAGISEK